MTVAASARAETAPADLRSLTALADGDRSAFELTFTLVLTSVREFIARQVAAGETDDLVQETMVAVFARAASFDSSRDALAWILGIAAWQVRSARTRKRRRHFTPISGDEVGQLPHEGPSPEEAAVIANLELALGRTLSELAPANADALLAWAGLRQRPPLPLATFRKRVGRALARARSLEDKP